MEILTNYALEIFFGLVSAGALGYCRRLVAQKRRLEEYVAEDQNRKYRQMIIDEIEPIIEEIHRVSNNLTKSIDTLKQEADKTHSIMYKDLEIVTRKNDKNLELIINSYKFRLIQLCKSHLRDGWITSDEFEQITEMYKLYTGLGGNGQAKDYYDRVMELDILKEPPTNRRSNDLK